VRKGKVRFPVQTLFDQKPKKNTTILEAMLENYTGTILKLDAITVLPSLKNRKYQYTHFFDKQFEEASVGSSITID
jgi:sulfate adenylyltransferase subunit 1